MALYVIVVLITLPILRANPTAEWRYLVALLPLVPVGLALLAVIRHVRRLDEFQQRIQLEAIAFAFVDTLLMAFAYGFLEIAGFPQIGMLWVLPYGIFAWVLGQWIANRRYRTNAKQPA